MAITFQNIPKTYALSDSPLMYRFSSNQTAQPNFSYIVKTYYNGSIISTDRVFPEVGTYAHWDASGAIRNVAFIPVLLPALHQDNQMLKQIKINVTENYGNPAVDQSNSDSTVTYTFKGKVPSDEFSALDLNANYKGKLWLTNSIDRSRTIMRGCDAYISMLVDSSKQLEMKFYANDGSLLHTYTSTQNYDIWQLNVKSSNLTATAGVPNINLVDYFTVQIGTSEIFTFNYHVEDCYTAHQLVWLNKFGVPDQFVFSHNNILKGSAKYMSYKKAFGQWEGNNFVYNAVNSGVKHFMTEVEKTGSLVSGWLSQNEQNFITEIYDSPYHLLINSSGSVSSIELKDASYELIQDKYEELFNEEIKYSKTGDYNSFVM